jgi:thiol-disulfide isomerase/thioredoxin
MPVIHIPSSISQNNLDTNASAINKYLKSGKDAFVLIYMDGCGPCSATHPKWEQLAPKFKNQNDIGVFDIEMSKLGAITHEGLTKNIAGYPTIRHVCKDSINEYEDCKEVSHDRSFNSFVDWIETETKNKKRAQVGGSRKTKRRKMQSSGRRRWSRKYKRSINCRRPRGFSQRQYCRGRMARKSRRK